MHPNIPTKTKQEEFLRLFVQVYSLPEYATQIKNTIFESPERKEKIKDLHDRLLKVMQIFQEDTGPFLGQLTPNKYLQGQNILRSKLMGYYEQLYPHSISFNVISDINKKLKGNYQKQCEQFLADIIQTHKQREMRKYVQDIIEKKFRQYDLDGNGSININEIESKLQRLNLPKLIAKQIMDKADSDKDGEISFEQFKQYADSHVLKYYKLFYNLDSDHDYKLNYLQTKQSLHEIYPDLKIGSVYDQIFRVMDQDGSGLINFQEWVDFLILFPQASFNTMINQWAMFATTLIQPQESSSFINKDLLKSTKIKDGKRVLSYWDILRTLVFGAIAGGVSRTITAPLQRLKVLYQTMYTQTKCPSIFKGLKQTIIKDGVKALFKGNSISVFLNCLEQALRFTIIQYSKKAYEVRGDKINPHQFLLIGVVTGVLSTLVLFPFQVLRIRFITSEDTSVFYKIRKIYHQSGPMGFYSGLFPHLISVLPAGSFNVMAYNTLRNLLVTDKDIEHPNLYKFMLIGGLGAFVTNTVTYPLSLVTSRIIMANKQIQLFKDKVKMHQMVRIIYKGQGLMGFYKGYQASTLRVFIGQAFNFGTYETLKIMWNMKRNYFNPSTKAY